LRRSSWAAPADGVAKANLLWYDKAAEKWEQALPVGNGRLGAMIFGQPEKDRLQLNDITVWSGAPQRDADRKDAYKNLPELRRLLREGKYAEAERFANRNFNGPAPYTASYQTLGDLSFEFQLPEGAVTNYRRWLDIDSAVAGAEFAVGKVTFTREVFASAPQGVLIVRLTSSRKGGLNFTMRLSRPASAQTRVLSHDTLAMTGNTDMPNLKSNLDYEVDARILSKNGAVSAAGDGLKVEGASEALVLVASATSFELDYAKGYRGAPPHDAAKRLAAAAKVPYAQLKSRHIADHQKYFRRVRLNLGPAGPAGNLPTDERLKKYGDGVSDPALAALFYQYGRYLLISCSRPDNPLPANLQGMWADGLNPPWQSDYHTNINLEMIYWPAELANLSEMHLPLLRFVANLAEPGARTAKAYFGPETPGWVLGYTTNGWSWTSPGERLAWGIWFGGSGWLCRHLWEHYAYTQDKDYLLGVYPVMRGAAEFWLANLVEGEDGKLIVSPSSSPENSFKTDSGVTATVTEGATMERAIVWDLLDKTARAAAARGVDPELRGKLVSARDRIRPLEIGKSGQLLEWNGDWDLNARDLHHRHVSHLYPLMPGDQIANCGQPGRAAQLLEAARKSLEIRGDESTGWAIAWKESLWARLRDGEHAHRLLADQLRYTEATSVAYERGGGTYPNLFDAHPPFQIDGNMGAVAGISEMLLQSHERYTDADSPAEDRYVIDLLPALPAAWRNGLVAGLKARGGFEVGMEWREGTLIKATIHSLSGRPARLRYGTLTREVKIARGATFEWNGWK
jgi:alpha-L-fucosidase 2